MIKQYQDLNLNSYKRINIAINNISSKQLRSQFKKAEIIKFHQYTLSNIIEAINSYQSIYTNKAIHKDLQDYKSNLQALYDYHISLIT